MQKTLAATLVAFAAFLMVAVTARPAAADDPTAAHWRYDGVNRELIGCNTQYRTGVLGQYGAAGYYQDGCTARAWCPNYTRVCKVTGDAWIGTYSTLNHWVTLNSRVRTFNTNGGLIGWQDTSCASHNYCASTPLTAWLRPGESASEQCNGVRAPAPNSASVRCHILVEYLY